MDLTISTYLGKKTSCPWLPNLSKPRRSSRGLLVNKNQLYSFISGLFHIKFDSKVHFI